MQTTLPGTAPMPHIQHAQQPYLPPPGSRQILLVRHGATGGEVVQTLAFGELTLSNPGLTARGQAQAEAVCARLRQDAPSRIFVTPLQRTQQTAAGLATSTGMVPIVVADLREVYLGEWEHGFFARAAPGNPLVAQLMAAESWDVIPGAEPMAGFSARIRAGIETIVACTAADSVSVAFLHGATIAEICRQATASRPFAFLAPENTSISRLVVKASGEWALRSFNDVAHLQGLVP